MSAEHYARWVLEPTLPERPTAPQSSYFVCTTPRSGSWLLCGLLASTGIAGRPHEYFGAETEPEVKRAWHVDEFSAYLRNVLAAGTTLNGVFGTKLMWGQTAELLARLRTLSGASSEGDHALLAQFFPQPRFVLLRRDDAVTQAVSWALAIQTGYWHSWDTARPDVEPRFDFDQIDALVRVIASHHSAWRQWFDVNRIDPLEVRFEDLVDDMELVARQVLAFLELDLEEEVVVKAQTAPTGSELNAEWAERYRGMAESRS